MRCLAAIILLAAILAAPPHLAPGDVARAHVAASATIAGEPRHTAKAGSACCEDARHTVLTSCSGDQGLGPSTRASAAERDAARLTFALLSASPPPGHRPAAPRDPPRRA